jgi:hypothetical protein
MEDRGMPNEEHVYKKTASLNLGRWDSITFQTVSKSIPR